MISTDLLLQKKLAYLNIPFFVVRLVVYILAWTLLSRFFYNQSVNTDHSNTATLNKAKSVSPVGIILFALTVTFAAFDWIMSLDPHWYSTIFGVYIFAGFLVSFLATCILVCTILQKAGYLENIVTTDHYHDLGKLLFAFSCFWAFMAFSQYMLIWYGNIPEETIFYSHRWVGNWKYVSLILPVAHFAVPFLLLMSRPTSRSRTFLCFMACWMLAIHFIDLHWLILPNFHHEGFHFSWLDATTLVAFAGILLGVLGRKLRCQALIPFNDPDLEASLHHHSR